MEMRFKCRAASLSKMEKKVSCTIFLKNIKDEAFYV